jgi:WD40-like Beta Propeller Repeat
MPGITTQAARFGEAPVLSGNGRYLAFTSSSNIYQPAGQGTEVFLLDLTTQQSQIVSVSPQGESGNAFAFYDSLSISADGRYVAFASDATNLVPNDVNGRKDVFVRDTLMGTTTLASVSTTGAQLAANTSDFTLGPGISANGQFVAFQSEANNLVPNDTNGDQDIFVRDLTAGTTTRVSVNSNGEQTRPWNSVASADSRNASISGDGRFVAFESNAINLDSRDTGANNFDIFVQDRQTGQTRQVSVNSQGQVATGASLQENSIGSLTTTSLSGKPVISTNGRYVVFQSGATNLVPNDTNNRVDIFRHDLETSETILISVGIDGNLANGGSKIGFSRNGAISGDGRYVVFESFASNLVENDNNNAVDIFVRDVVTGSTERISVNSSGQEAVGGAPSTVSGNGTISDDGRYVAFESLNANLANNSLDPFIVSTYLRDRLSASPTPPPVTPPPAIAPPNSSPTYNSGWVSNLLSATASPAATSPNSLGAGSTIPTGANGPAPLLPNGTSPTTWAQWF